jgi:hypothetical protein
LGELVAIDAREREPATGPGAVILRGKPPHHYPLEVRFGSFKITPDQKLLSVEDNHRKICVVCVEPLRFTSNIVIIRRMITISLVSQLWAEPEHDGGLVMTGAE